MLSQMIDDFNALSIVDENDDPEGETPEENSLIFDDRLTIQDKQTNVDGSWTALTSDESWESLARDSEYVKALAKFNIINDGTSRIERRLRGQGFRKHGDELLPQVHEIWKHFKDADGKDVTLRVLRQPSGAEKIIAIY
jgi:hypothetical protein